MEKYRPTCMSCCHGLFIIVLLQLIGQVHPQFNGNSGGVCGDWIKLDHSCYMFSSFPATWAGAVALCRAFEASLIEIGSAEETTAVVEYIVQLHGNHSLQKYDYWTAGNDIEKEGKYRWIGSDSLFGYTNWMIGQPDPAEQDCIEMRGVSDFRWHDDNCQHMHLFICERGLYSVGQEIIG